MSIIFGMVRKQGGCVIEEDLRLMGNPTRRFAAEGTHVRASGMAGMGIQPNSTHERANLELQPGDLAGNVAVLDGRLDNYQDLCDLLDLRSEETSDSQIVLASYTRWGEQCFARFVGDWAVAIWSPLLASLYLARDHAGTRTLYFKRTDQGISFSTYLDTFICESRQPDVDIFYAARYLAGFPAGDLTPYRDVTAVTPAHFLVFRETNISRRAHWNWVATDQIAYKADSEYEEHFLELFTQSVKRRTGPGASILAQLSGGMDSSSIVCLSDSMRRSGGCGTQDLVDTISYFDDTEPHWNERPFFSAVERNRGKTGFHVDVSKRKRSFKGISRSERLCCGPGGDSSTLLAEDQLETLIGPRGYRVILSGIGGDELLGGVPTVIPQLADFAFSGQVRKLFSVALAECLSTKAPILQLLFKTAVFTAELYLPEFQLSSKLTPPWLTTHGKKLLRKSIAPRSPVRFWPPGYPSAIESGATWWKVLDSMPHLVPSSLTRYEYRYPYLDRDLVDFLFRVPKDQLVRPGRRRSLMRSALKTIVPVEVLERRRKGYLSRTQALSLVEEREEITSKMASSLLSSYRLTDPTVLRRHLSAVGSRHEERWVPTLTRAVLFEVFLRSLNGIP
jgi:asparagine synthase (glutamine-hydrolysing)